MKRLALAVLAGLVTCACARADATIPPAPTRWVTDTAYYLTPRTVNNLDAKLRTYQGTTQHSVLVWITVDRLGPTPIETYCFRAFNGWSVGRRGYDDGVVLFMFPADHLARIQVGYGFERAIPDREATRIVREVMVPEIRAHGHDAGVVAAVEAILAAIERGGLD